MRMVLVSNRLPLVIECDAGAWSIRPGSGGLVTALGPVLCRRGGLWVGWPGGESSDESAIRGLLREQSKTTGYILEPVFLTREEVEGFYNGFCNEIIWPLFHDLQSRCNFVPEYWTHYLNVQDRYAQVVHGAVQGGDMVWVQDYHLIGLGRRLRELGLQERVGFFLHIPFPPPDIFLKLPWRDDVLTSLLEYDVLGLQTPRDRENLLDCVRKLRPKAKLRRAPGAMACHCSGRTTRIGVFPIGIDYQHFADGAGGPRVTERVAALRQEIPSKQMVLSVDRLDYTKGIPYRLRAFQLALRRYPDLHKNVTLLQVVVPSRESVPEYQDLKAQIEQLVTQVNGEFTQPGWVPIHHVFRSIEWEELLAFYRVADVALITPLKDGMNLVSKEYCACQVENNGVLILSEFAGAAVQLGRDAILVNPYDTDRVADAIYHAVMLSPEARTPSMRRLRGVARREDVFWWVDRFLSAFDPTGPQRPPVLGRVNRELDRGEPAPAPQEMNA